MSAGTGTFRPEIHFALSFFAPISTASGSKALQLAALSIYQSFAFLKRNGRFYQLISHTFSVLLYGFKYLQGCFILIADYSAYDC